MAKKNDDNMLIGLLILLGGLGAAAVAIAAEKEKKQMVFACPNCGQSVAQQSPFCGHCGRALLWPA